MKHLHHDRLHADEEAYHSKPYVALDVFLIPLFVYYCVINFSDIIEDQTDSTEDLNGTGEYFDLIGIQT